MLEDKISKNFLSVRDLYCIGATLLLARVSDQNINSIYKNAN